MNLQATYLQDIRAQYPSNLDRDEMRTTQVGLMNAVLTMTNADDSIISGDLMDKAKLSQGRNLDIPVMKKGAVTINNARSCNIQCSESESALTRIVWKTASVDICMIPTQYINNEVKYLADLNKKIRERVEAFGVAIETDLDLALETAKNQVYNSSIATGKYGAGSELTVLEADKKLFFNDIDPINFEDDFYSSSVYVVGSPALMAPVRYFINQGAGNNENLGWQFNGKNFTFSNRITNTEQATGYFMPSGSIGLLTRVDAEARMKAESTSGTKWWEDTLPGLPFTVGVQYKSDCQDKEVLASELSGITDGFMKATLVEHWQISFDYAIVLPYNSDAGTKPGAIRKFIFDDGVA